MNSISTLAKAAALKAAGMDLTHAYQTGGEDAVAGLGGKQGMGASKTTPMRSGGDMQSTPKPQARPPVQAAGAGGAAGGGMNSAPSAAKLVSQKTIPAAKGGVWEQIAKSTGMGGGAESAALKSHMQGGAASAANSGVINRLRHVIDKQLRRGSMLGGATPGARRGRAGMAVGAGAAAMAGMTGMGKLMGGGGGGAPQTAQAPGAAPGGQPSPMPAAAGGDGAQLAGMGGGVMDWIKANPGKAALLGLVPAAGYGLSRMMSGPKKDKEAGDYLGDLPRNRQELVKLAADTVCHNSLVVVGHQLEKMAAEAQGQLRRGFQQMQAVLLASGNIYKAASVAFPELKPAQRSKLSKSIVKRAFSELHKAACFPGCNGGSKSNKGSFHGKPQEAHAWMKANS